MQWYPCILHGDFSCWRSPWHKLQQPQWGKLKPAQAQLLVQVCIVLCQWIRHGKVDSVWHSPEPLIPFSSQVCSSPPLCHTLSTHSTSILLGAEVTFSGIHYSLSQCIQASAPTKITPSQNASPDPSGPLHWVTSFLSSCQNIVPYATIAHKFKCDCWLLKRKEYDGTIQISWH